MSDAPTGASSSVPNVYFIDDSATMREVVKIACRRENFNVIACADVASAVGQFERTPPDAVISDVIMPDRDGYQLCEYVKVRSAFSAAPVILLSGIVNRDVADKAHQAGADELMRKPFHPQELIACVKKLLGRRGLGGETAPTATPAASNVLGELFGVPVAVPGQAPPLGGVPPVAPPAAVQSGTPPGARPAVPSSASVVARLSSGAPATTPVAPAAAKPASAPAVASSTDLVRLRTEVQRLEFLVKKLQAQLDTEREYCASLESQLRTLSTTTE